MRYHLRAVAMAALIPFLLPHAGKADTLIDGFDAGISLDRWDVFKFDAPDAPWTVAAPDSQGRLQIAKDSDSGFPPNCYGLIQSRFELMGNLSVFVDFDLVTFPFSNVPGRANEAVVRLVGTQTGSTFAVLRYTDTANHYAEGFSDAAPYVIGNVTDATMSGRLGITRQGQTMTAWIDRGAGPVTLGTLSSSQLDEPMRVQVYVAPIPYDGLRATTPLDVRFDNVTITADSIVPEPTTLLLLIGGLAMTRKRYWV